MSNREYFLTYCVQKDLCAIYRYAMWELASQFEDKPLGERTEIFEKWLNQPMDMKKWNAARSRSTESY